MDDDPETITREFTMRYKGMTGVGVAALALVGIVAVFALARLILAHRRAHLAEERADQAERDKETMASTHFGGGDLPKMLGRTLSTANDRPLEILRKVGNGAMGAVFEAASREGGGRDERWAVKVPFRDTVVKADARRRFLREAEICKGVFHRGLVQVIDWGTFDVPEDRQAGDWPFLVMELMNGQTLGHVIERDGGGGLPIDQVVGWMREMAETLGKLHEAGIVHRDLKPDNIFVTPSGHLKIGDFGLSGRTDRHSVTQSGEAFGTPMYMSPEHLEARSTTGASDLYSMGAISYEMLCGEPPFKAETTIAVLNRMLTEDPQPLVERRSEVPPALDGLVADLMARDPEGRPTVAEILARLGSLGTKGTR
ncbi:MAG: serine/threonine protein kinase [Proteobacteria bacterium]|nr:serine/threonine protein kinase [Pseudomonadota bacterium]